VKRAIVWNNFSKPPPTPYRNIPLVLGEHPTQEELKRIFSYNEDTGHLHWKFRPKETFASPASMTKFYKHYAGKSAGKLQQGVPIVVISDKTYRTKNLVWLYHYGELPQSQVRCIDGNKLNTRIQNLTIN
jgi:hypothetical protein